MYIGASGYLPHTNDIPQLENNTLISTADDTAILATENTNNEFTGKL